MDTLHDLLASVATILCAVHRKKGAPVPTREDFLPWRRRGGPDRPVAVPWERDLKAGLVRAGAAVKARKAKGRED